MLTFLYQNYVIKSNITSDYIYSRYIFIYVLYIHVIHTYRVLLSPSQFLIIKKLSNILNLNLNKNALIKYINK